MGRGPQTAKEAEISRAKRLYSRLEELGCQAFLISHVPNIRYVLGRPRLFDADFPGLLLLSEGGLRLFLDYRYLGLAAEALAGEEVELVRYERDVLGALTERLAKEGLERLGFEAAHMSAWAASRLAEKVESLMPLTGLVEELRVIKEEVEINLLRQAAVIADSVFPRILDTLRPGVRESDIALELEYLLRKAGAESVSFEPIVASGPNSAYPHAGSGDRLIESGDFVKLDYGCVRGGYCSDMTRTVVVGKASAEQKSIHRMVRDAQAAAIAGLRPGMSGEEADRLARVMLPERDGAVFGHGLGHGVGLEVHEAPRLGKGAEAPLAVNMVFTVEPGLYKPGLGGVRIEDMVVLGQNNVSVLTGSPRELLEL